jgi:hypothetical protein
LSAKRFRAFASKRVVSSRIFWEVGEMYFAELDDGVPRSATTRPVTDPIALLACLGRPFLTANPSVNGGFGLDRRRRWAFPSAIIGCRYRQEENTVKGRLSAGDWCCCGRRALALVLLALGCGPGR